MALLRTEKVVEVSEWGSGQIWPVICPYRTAEARDGNNTDAVSTLDPALVSSWLSTGGLRRILQRDDPGKPLLLVSPFCTSLPSPCSPPHLPSLPERRSPRYGVLLLNGFFSPHWRAECTPEAPALCPEAWQGDASLLPGKQP